MSAHHEQIASYFCRLAICEVRELRCTTCHVLVKKFLWSVRNEAAVQQQMREAWHNHITPAEMDFQI